MAPPLLVAAVGLGAAVYLIVLAALWLLAGRPEGPEADLLALLRRTLRRGA
jgi:hypothetical protein